MPLYIADYLADTRRLTLEEHGAYMLLIMEYWRNGGIPADDAKIARILGQNLKDWMRLKPSVQEFFEDGWRHKRIDEELAKNTEISNRRSDAANKRWKCKSNANASANGHASAYANDMRSQSQSHILDTNVSNISADPSPLDVLSECLSEQTARDVIEHRKKLRKPMTARAARELAKSFLAYGNPEAAAAAMIANGWQGFHPTWIENQTNRTGPPKAHNGKTGGFTLLKQAILENERAKSTQNNGLNPAVQLLPVNGTAKPGTSVGYDDGLPDSSGRLFGN
jgi:uncharacterized protein YdaU (DUF1376 family)